MIDATLIMLLKNQPRDEVLLGFKKFGFGKGKYSGFGGKVEKGETICQAAVREFAEETGIFLSGSLISLVSILNFRFPYRPQWDQRVHVFIAKFLNKDPIETQEMIPKWFPFEEVPYEKMWDDARYWLPQILTGKTFQAEFSFKKDNSTVSKAVFNPLKTKFSSQYR